MVDYLSGPQEAAGNVVSVVPPVIQRAVPPGQAESTHFSIDGAKGSLKARFVPDVASIKLVEMQSMRVTQRPFNPETDGPLPNGVRPPPFVVERELVEAVGPGATLRDVTGLDVLCKITFQTNASMPWLTSTMLIFDASESGPFSVPVNLFCGLPTVTVLGQPVQAEIGRTTLIRARVSLPRGAPAVALTLSAIDGPVTILPRVVAVAGTMSSVAELNLSLSVATEPGILQSELIIDGFANEQFSVPFRVKAVLPPPPAEPVDHPANLAAINNYWLGHGAQRGPLGYPMAKTERNGHIFLRRFTGGGVKSVSARASLDYRQWVRVRFVGHRCHWKQTPHGNDEPYFIIGVAGANGAVTRRFGPYSVDAGQDTAVMFEVAGPELMLVPPITLAIVGLEHDSGTPSEAEDKVRIAMAALPEKLASVPDPSSVEVDSHVVGKFLRDLGVGKIWEVLAQTFGMGDDPIDRRVLLLYDEKVNEQGVFGNKGHFCGQYFNIWMPFGKANGFYDLYFHAELVVDPNPPEL